MRRFPVPGAQLAVRHRGTLVAAEAGLEHHPLRRPMRTTSTVPVGSITKAVTATLAMVLVAEGDLDLDAPVADLVPGLRGTAVGASVTPRMMLRHTGGLPSDPGEHCAHPRDLLAELRHAVPVCAPGTAFSYSNVGYALLGMIVEEVTGLSWREAVDGIVLRPLGVDAAFVGGPGPAPTAAGHAGVPGAGPRVVEQVLPPVLAPVGGLALSARDLVAFGEAHLGKPGLLDVVTAAEMHTAGDAEPFGLADAWALGLACFRGWNTEWLGHDGTADGTSCHLRIDKTGQTVVALTTNAAGGAALWRALQADLRKLGLHLPDYRAHGQRAQRVPVPDDCFGAYRNGALEYVVARGDGEVCLTVDGEVHHDLVLYDCGTLSVPDPVTGRHTDCGRIVRDPGTGEVTALQIGGRLARRA
ncbi:beta-lactamase family protein [Amycolatopsis bartoniae]|nr:beta-lactamase family protein [Amycolatopsis bartoniae]